MKSIAPPAARVLSGSSPTRLSRRPIWRCTVTCWLFARVTKRPCERMASGIFVSYRGYLEGPRGGVQVCTQEYIEIIKAAGVDLRFCPFEGDRRLSTRILRRIVSSGYFRPA